MIGYAELDRFYTGTSARIIGNTGGIVLELGEDSDTLFYKIDDDYYYDVNSKHVAQVLRTGCVITTKYLVIENTLVKVKNRKEVNNNAPLVKRITFNSSKVPKK